MSSTRSVVLKHPQAVLDDPVRVYVYVYVLNQFNVFGTSNQVKALMHIKYIISHELRITWGYVSAASFHCCVNGNYVDWNDNLMCNKYLSHYEKIMSVEGGNWNKGKIYIF